MRLLLCALFLAFVTGVYQDVYPAQKRVVAFGDIHGDFKALVSVLLVSGVLSYRVPPPSQGSPFPWIRSQNWSWVGGSTFVVQTGDQVDFGGRGTDSPDVSSEREVFEFMDRLDAAARPAGGAVISLWGNHELMNAKGDFRYVTAKGFADFGGQAQRKQTWAPGSSFLNHFAETRPVVLKIGDFVFCHGGVEPEMALLNVSTINYIFREVMLKHNVTPSQRNAYNAIQGSNGPMWNRVFASPPVDCANLAVSLDRLQAKAFVLGHTPGLKVMSYCSNRVFVIDTQMSRAFGLTRRGDPGDLARYWALEIRNGTTVRPLNEQLSLKDEI